MSDHNIIQIETNIKIVEEKQNGQIKKSNLGCKDMNFFNEDIRWASIGADLLNTSWDMFFTDVKTDEMHKIIINICGKFAKNMFCRRKFLENTKYHETDGRALMRKRSKSQKKIQMSTTHQTKENVLNQIKEIENNLKESQEK